MTPKQAAAIIGVDTHHVRYLIRSGKLIAKRVNDDTRPAGYIYDITHREAERWRDMEQKTGRPRGGRI